jgi:predicted DNA-binding transcriptional regulator YafY
VLYVTRFTPCELVSLYLVARLLARYSDEANPHIVKALEKLADALLVHSPLVSRHITQSAELVGCRPARPEYVHAFETLTQAWLLSRKARVIYQGFHDLQATERLFSPYVIEPSGLAYSSYVVGYDDLRGAVRTFKLERIQSAQLTDEPFLRPDDFDSTTRLLLPGALSGARTTMRKCDCISAGASSDASKRASGIPLKSSRICLVVHAGLT